jgi:microcystin-dependent protein
MTEPVVISQEKFVRGASAGGLELGETESTAYRGDRGKTAYDHSQTPHAPTNAQPNNISDANALDLTDNGTTTLHYHANDRSRANHTGTQTASTISDFTDTVRATALTGLSLLTSTAVTAADSILAAIGKLQAQVTGHTGNTSNPHSVTKTQLSLGNVDNTSDASKPISTAAQTALDLKAALVSPVFTGTPTAPTAPAITSDDQLATTQFVHDVASASGAFPMGGIIIWSGLATAIPSGWALCDGNNGTPNLLDRFIVGAGSTYTVGSNGGSSNVTLSTTQLPSHTHGATVDSGGAHQHNYYIGNNYGSGSISGARMSCTGIFWENRTNLTSYATSLTASNGAHIHTASISNLGGGLGHENRPPYYALCYIMKV